MAETIVDGVEMVADGFTLTESPRWHKGRLYFSDMHARRVCALDEAGHVETVMSFDDDKPSGLGFLPDGEMIIVLMDSAKLMRLGKGGLTLHADLSRFADGEINDMAVAPSGRAYVGQLGFKYSNAPNPTTLMTVGPDGESEIAASDLWCPNGIALTLDGRTLVTAEWASNRITAFDIKLDGRLANRRVFATLPGPNQGADGICLDNHGGIWAGVPMDKDVEGLRSPGFLRIEEGGRVTHRIPVAPGRRAVACAFGGATRDWLYLCTTGDFMASGFKTIEGGRIERIKIAGFSGAGVP